jgi:hypothetical protein
MHQKTLTDCIAYNPAWAFPTYPFSIFLHFLFCRFSYEKRCHLLRRLRRRSIILENILIYVVNIDDGRTYQVEEREHL